MVLILYGFVVFLATLLGSFVGLGGGVIIKPVLDVINAHSLTEISFFSSCAVFAMSITSTTRHTLRICVVFLYFFAFGNTVSSDKNF